MCLQTGEVAISLGTSDTVFLSLNTITPSLEGNVSCNPIDPEAYMALIWYMIYSLKRSPVEVPP